MNNPQTEGDLLASASDYEQEQKVRKSFRYRFHARMNHARIVRENRRKQRKIKQLKRELFFDY